MRKFRNTAPKRDNRPNPRNLLPTNPSTLPVPALIPPPRLPFTSETRFTQKTNFRNLLDCFPDRVKYSPNLQLKVCSFPLAQLQTSKFLVLLLNSQD